MQFKYALAILSTAALTATAANAQDYSSNFSALGTGGVGGFYYFIGDSASQTFNGTGLTSVTSLDLDLTGANNFLAAPLTIGFQINGVDVGSATFNPAENPNRLLNFVFGPIAGAAGSYTLSASVTVPVPSGAGALQFSTQNPFTLSAGGAVPEPATWAIMMLGFGAVGCSMRRARRQQQALAA